MVRAQMTPHGIKVGSYVEERDEGRVYIGHVIDINPQRPDRIYVRWHKGFASWTDAAPLRKIRRPNP